MKIQFVLPGPGAVPVGGLKVYQYANQVAARGHDVVVIYSANRRIDATWHKWARKWAVYWYIRLRGQTGPEAWFTLSPAVRQRSVASPSQGRVEDADVVIATSWETAEWVAGFNQAKGNQFYLIQHLETRSGSCDGVMATWRLPIRKLVAKLVVARWLQEAARLIGERSTYLPNGLDWDEFGIDTPPDGRQSATIMLLHHTSGWKGYGDAMSALALVAKDFPALAVTIFGVSPPPPSLPSYATYNRLPRRPVLGRLYNENATFSR